MEALMDRSQTSRELVERAQAGDRDAFEELLRRHQEPVAALAATRLRAHDIRTVDAEDVLQEVLLRGFRGFASFTWQGDESFVHWLGGIARNVVLELARRGARNPVFRLEREVPQEGVSPSRALRREERFDRLADAVARLPAQYGDVISMARIEGLSFEEIGRRLDRSPAAAKQLLWRALKALKESFGDTESLHLPGRCLGGDSDEDLEGDVGHD